MKRTHTFIIFVLLTLSAPIYAALTPRQILDKTASVVGKKGGATAQFTITMAKQGTIKGTIAIKGRKFYAQTPQTVTWYDGKTQWTYVTDTDEVNISTPTKAQQTQINPYTFLSLYKKGFTLSAKKVKGMYEVHLTPQNKQQSIQEAVITIHPTTFQPSLIKLKQKNKWMTISISGFRAVNQDDATFVFPAKKYATAEIIDLR